MAAYGRLWIFWATYEWLRKWIFGNEAISNVFKYCRLWLHMDKNQGDYRCLLIVNCHANVVAMLLNAILSNHG
jgi:hypothetical protein